MILSHVRVFVRYPTHSRAPPPLLYPRPTYICLLKIAASAPWSLGRYTGTPPEARINQLIIGICHRLSLAQNRICRGSVRISTWGAKGEQRWRGTVRNGESGEMKCVTVSVCQCVIVCVLLCYCVCV